MTTPAATARDTVCIEALAAMLVDDGTVLLSRLHRLRGAVDNPLRPDRLADRDVRRCNTLRAMVPKGAAGVVDVGVTVPGKAEVVKAASCTHLASQGTMSALVTNALSAARPVRRTSD